MRYSELVKLTDLALGELEEQNLAAFSHLDRETLTQRNMTSSAKPTPSQSVRVLIMSLQRLLDPGRRNTRIRTRPLRSSVTAHVEVCRLQALLFERKHNGHG